MNKKEKYINYIVDDLINKTEINYVKKKISPPFSPPLSNTSYYSFSLFSTLLLLSFSSYFSTYVKERYGTREEEVNIVWDLYRERIQSLIDDE